MELGARDMKSWMVDGHDFDLPRQPMEHEDRGLEHAVGGVDVEFDAKDGPFGRGGVGSGGGGGVGEGIVLLSGVGVEIAGR